MELGIIYPYDQKKLDKEIKEGVDVSIGIELNQLLDQIGALEIKYAYELGKVLGELKASIMQALGKVELNESKK